VRRVRRPSPALILSGIALFFALGGVSYGLATGSINSREIKNNSVRSKDVRNNSLRSRDVHNNSLTGRDISEVTLGAVPHAGVADSVDGRNFAAINYRAPAGSPTTTILGFAGLQINATCAGNGDLNASATTTVNNAMVHVGTLHPGTGSYASDNNLDIGQRVDLLGSNDRNVEGTLTYTGPTGAIVTATYLAQELTDGLQSANDCFVIGQVVG